MDIAPSTQKRSLVNIKGRATNSTKRIANTQQHKPRLQNQPMKHDVHQLPLIYFQETIQPEEIDTMSTTQYTNQRHESNNTKTLIISEPKLKPQKCC